MLRHSFLPWRWSGRPAKKSASTNHSWSNVYPNRVQEVAGASKEADDLTLKHGDAERSPVSCAVPPGIFLGGGNFKRRYDFAAPKCTHRPGDFCHTVGTVQSNRVISAAIATPLARYILRSVVIGAHVDEGNRVYDNSATDGHTNQPGGLWLDIVLGATVSTPRSNLDRLALN